MGGVEKEFYDNFKLRKDLGSFMELREIKDGFMVFGFKDPEEVAKELEKPD